MKRSIIVLLVVLGLLFGAAPASAQIYWYAINGNLFAAGPIMLPDGTAAAPAMAFGTATGTGIYKLGSAVAVATAGVSRGYFDGAGLTLTGASGSGGTLTLGGRTVTVNTQPALNIAETWNEGSTTFAGIKYVLTDTASASGSLPFQILCGAAGATNCFSVNKTGGIVTPSYVNAGATSGFALGSSALIYAPSSSVVNITVGNATGLQTLNLGPLTGNSANGTLSITKTSTVCTIDTDTGCTGKTTNVVTMTAGSLPAASLVLGVTCKNTVAITGSAGFATYAIGDGTTANKWGATVAKTLNATANIGGYAAGSPTYQLAAGSLVFTANAAETFTAGVISCTVYSINFTPIGS